MGGLTEETRKITSCEIPQTISKWCYSPDALLKCMLAKGDENSMSVEDGNSW